MFIRFGNKLINSRFIKAICKTEVGRPEIIVYLTGEEVPSIFTASFSTNKEREEAFEEIMDALWEVRF